MLYLNGNNITLTRGDTLQLQVDICYYDGEAYQPVEGDVVQFFLKPQYKPGVVVEVDIPIDTLVLELGADVTKALPSGYFAYDIQLTKADGYVDTFLSGTLIITEEVA